MASSDLKVFETGNGGDILVQGNDFAYVDGFQNMPYLAMFGGNVEQDTSQVGADDEQRFDWWGNGLIAAQAAQNNSLTERKLGDTPITSQGRQLIEQSVRADVAFMQEFAVVDVSVRVVTDDWLNISMTIRQPGAVTNKDYQYIWDATKGQILASEGYEPFVPGFDTASTRITQSGVLRVSNDNLIRLV